MLAVRLAVRLSVGQPGLFMVVDCEFVSPQRLSADQDIDIDLSDLPSVYARIYDLAIIICDADGNVVERVFHERSVNGQLADLLCSRQGQGPAPTPNWQQPRPTPRDATRSCSVMDSWKAKEICVVMPIAAASGFAPCSYM